MTSLSSAVRIDAHVVPILSYALAHNRVPVLRGLALTNDGPEQRSVQLSVVVRDAQGSLSVPFQAMVDLAPGTTRLEEIDFRLDPAKFLLVEEQRPGSLEVAVSDESGVVAERTFPIQVLAAQQWLAGPVPLA